LPQLGERGLLTRKADPGDQRRSVIAVSAKGRALFETIAPESEQIYAGIEKRLGSAELRELYRLLDRVIGLLPGQAG
jgi:DNA-binding MarR family transcriptional regulator